MTKEVLDKAASALLKMNLPLIGLGTPRIIAV